MFESQRDHKNEYQNSSNSCKSTICRSFIFADYPKIFINSQKKVSNRNAYLNTLQEKVFGAHSELVRCGEVITAESIKDKYSFFAVTPDLLTLMFIN